MWSKPQLELQNSFTFWEGRGCGEQRIRGADMHLSMPTLEMHDVAQDCPGDAR